MLKAVYSWSLFIFSAVVMIILSIPFMSTDPVTSENVMTYNVHYQNVIQNRYRGHFSYDLMTTEGKSYKIASDYSDCFQYKDFLTKVKAGEALSIKIKLNKGYIFSDNEVLTSLEMDGKLYLEANCFNNSLSYEKISIPLALFVMLATLYFILLYGERKKLPKMKYKR